MTAQSDWRHASIDADEADNDAATPEYSSASSTGAGGDTALDADPDVIVVPGEVLDEDDPDDLDTSPAEDAELDNNELNNTAVHNGAVHNSAVDGSAVDDSELGRTALTDGELEDSKLEDSKLEDSELDDGTVNASALEDSELEDSDLEDSDLEDSELEDSELDDGTVNASAVEESDLDDNIVTAEVVPPAEPGQNGFGAAGTARTGSSAGSTVLGPQWHDIQAQFVDDPRGSVQLAAAAVDDAVTELVETLKQRRAGLVPATGTAEDPESTEQLREALVSCRMFCENLADISERFARPEAMAS